MAKIYTYIVFIAGLSLLLGLAGIQTFGGLLLQATGFMSSTGVVQTNGAGILNSPFYLALNGIFGAILIVGAVGSIFAGLIGSQKTNLFITAAFVATLLIYVTDITKIIGYMDTTYHGDWTSYLVLLILAPIAIGYLASIVQYWNGVD